jgi:hypothetical protein
VRTGAKRPIPAIGLTTNYYQLLRQNVVDCERYILKELGFELNRLTEHAHKFLLYYLKTVRAQGEVPQKAWNYINDCYLTTICINYPPNVIAASCLYLAFRTTSTPMPKNIWWAIFETSIKHILELSSDLMNVYSQPKVTLEELKRTLEECYSRNGVQKEYKIDDELETEKILQQQVDEELKAQKASEKAPEKKPQPKRSPPREKRHGTPIILPLIYLDSREDKKKKKKKKKYSSSSRSSSSDSDRKRKKKKNKKRSSSSSSSSRSSSKGKKRRDRSDSRRNKKKDYRRED